VDGLADVRGRPPVSIRTLDEFEAVYKSELGLPLPLGRWNALTEEEPLRFSDGVGDHNPLYREEEYAAKARHHHLVASPARVMVHAEVRWRDLGEHPREDISTADFTIL
jgi:acyl dehydratase